jgi:hypothetical protein
MFDQMTPSSPARRINIEGLGEVLVEELLDGGLVRLKFKTLAVVMEPFIIPQMEKVAVMEPSDYEETLLKDSLEIMWRAFNGPDNDFAMAVSTLFSTLCILREENPPIGQMEMFVDDDHPQIPTREELLKEIETKIRKAEVAAVKIEGAQVAAEKGMHVFRDDKGQLRAVKRGGLFLWGLALITSIVVPIGSWVYQGQAPDSWLWAIPVFLIIFAPWLVGEQNVSAQQAPIQEEEREDKDDEDNRS